MDAKVNTASRWNQRPGVSVSPLCAQTDTTTSFRDQQQRQCHSVL